MVMSLTVGVIAAVAAGIVAYMELASDAGSRELLSEAAPGEAVLQLSTRLHADPTSQDQAARRQVAQVVGDVPHRLLRSVVAPPIAISNVDGRAVADGSRAVFASYEDPADHGIVVEGAWPSDSGQVAVHMAAAESLGLGLGSTVTLEGGAGQWDVVGVWQPEDVAAPFWFADDLELQGVVGSRFGPFVVIDEAIGQQARSMVRWRLTADPAQTQAVDLPVLRRGADLLPSRFRTDNELVASVLWASGELASTLDAVVEQVEASRGIALTALTAFLLVGLVAWWQVVRLIVSARRPETTLLCARGASVARLTTRASREAVAVGIFAILLGGGSTVLVPLWLAPAIGSEGRVPFSQAAWLTAAAVVVVAALVLIGAVAFSARTAIAAGRAETSGRVRAATTGAAVLMVMIGAAASVWQLRRFGSPVIRDSTVDPLAVAAPGLLLLAMGLFVLALFGPIAYFVERTWARQAGVVLQLGVLQVGRRLPAFAVPIVVTVFASGFATIAGAYAATWVGLQHEAATFRTGADVQVRFDRPPSVHPAFPPTTAAPFDQLDGVSRAAALVVASGRIRDGELALVAMPTAAYPELVRGVESLPTGLADSDGNGVLIPNGADEISVQVEVSAQPSAASEASSPPTAGEGSTASASLELQLFLVDADGVVATSLLEPIVVSGDEIQPGNTTRAVTRRLAVPQGSEPWTLAAVDVTVAQEATRGVGVEVAVTELTGHGDSGVRVVDLSDVESWAVQERASDVPDGLRVSSVQGVGVALAVVGQLPGEGDTTGDRTSIGRQTARIRLAAGPGDPNGVLPAVVSQMLARHLGVGAGDRFEANVSGSVHLIEVAGVADTVPGIDAEFAAIADRRVLVDALIRRGAHLPPTNQVWIAGQDTDGRITVAAESVVGDSGRVVSTWADARDRLDSIVLRQTITVFWVAAVGTGIVAMVASAVTASVLGRQRRREVAVFRALGMPARMQARVRRGEQLAVLSVGILAGALMAFGMVRLFVGVLAEAATPMLPRGVTSTLEIGWLPWALAVGGLMLAAASIAAGSGMAVARHARWAVVGRDEQ